MYEIHESEDPSSEATDTCLVRWIALLVLLHHFSGSLAFKLSIAFQHSLEVEARDQSTNAAEIRALGCYLRYALYCLLSILSDFP